MTMSAARHGKRRGAGDGGDGCLRVLPRLGFVIGSSRHGPAEAGHYVTFSVPGVRLEADRRGYRGVLISSCTTRPSTTVSADFSRLIASSGTFFGSK
jgi:hypothetical protein